MSHPTYSFSLHSSRKNNIKAVDTLAYFIGIAGNLAVIPQIILVWQSDPPGLAISTWIFFTFFGIIWLIYAIVHKSKPLIIAQTIGILCNLLVVAGWAFHHWM
jgi:uncharacterized protein with PQ loop repeat